jgi:hypothetical protein
MVVSVPVRPAVLAALAVFALVLGSGCSIRVGDEDPVDPVFGTGNTVEWDLSRPLEAIALGLPDDEMTIVGVPDKATVTLKLPRGTWSGRTEQMTVITRHGYVDSVDLFWTEADGQAAENRMVADADLLGIDAARVGQWGESAAAAETGTKGPRLKDNFNGSNSRVSTAVKPGMAVGEGAGTPVRLWYLFYLRDVVEPGPAK